MAGIVLEKEKIRTMKKDLREAGGEIVYPPLVLQSEEPIPEKIGDLEFLPKISAIEKMPEIILPPKIEEEKKKAETLAFELAESANVSTEKIKEKMLQEEPPVPKPVIAAEPVKLEPIIQTPEPQPSPQPEELPKLEELPKEEIPAPEEKPQGITLAELIKEQPEISEPSIEEEPVAAFNMPEEPVGLEEVSEKIPSAEELGLEEPEEISEVKAKKAERAEKDHQNEEKLRQIAESSLELEDSLKKISEEKAPYERQKDKIEEEINNIKKKAELSIERKKRLEETKKELERKEEEAPTPDERRAAEKERWRMEDERNEIEKEIIQREDEIKSLRLQSKEIDINLDKILSKEKIAQQEMEVLQRNKNIILLSQTKEELENKLKPLDAEIDDIKREMFENTKVKDKTERTLTEMGIKEKSVEDEIKILERRGSETTDEVVLRDIENRRRTVENSRRKLEQDRWDIEDKLRDLEEKRKLIKERYQEVASQAKVIRNELNDIQLKIK